MPLPAWVLPAFRDPCKNPLRTLIYMASPRGAEYRISPGLCRPRETAPLQAAVSSILGQTGLADCVCPLTCPLARLNSSVWLFPFSS